MLLAEERDEDGLAVGCEVLRLQAGSVEEESGKFDGVGLEGVGERGFEELGSQRVQGAGGQKDQELQVAGGLLSHVSVMALEKGEAEGCDGGTEGELEQPLEELGLPVDRLA
jgi:hypothetical protein